MSKVQYPVKECRRSTDHGPRCAGEGGRVGNRAIESTRSITITQRSVRTTYDTNPNPRTLTPWTVVSGPWTLILSLFFFLQACEPAENHSPGWPTTTNETKPWTRWWWHGSALSKEGITAEMEAYQKAGLGGLEITPIYGVIGYEDKFVNYLSPEWMELLSHTLKEAKRLGLGIDMATGTGWPFGGPWVSEADACKNFQYKVFELKGGSTLREKIEFIQQPYLRAVGNQVYEVHDSFSLEKNASKGTRKEPLARLDPKSIDIKTLKQPISSNKNLQALALDQVVFEKSLPLKTLMAYSDNGEVLDLTEKVDANKILNWTAPPGNWKLYAVFEGSHGKMVERAGPGGEGNVIDHFSEVALKHYLHRFDSAFAGKDISSLRAFFNDSYEVDDARGAADWTPDLFEEFKSKRGYDLRQHLPALFGQDEPDKNVRVLCDYRETISELLLERFTSKWTEWAHEKSAITRNQAHGSPANILDLYGTVDIPEIEGVDPLRMKLASSAGNVSGKKLVSSESATWLGEHFESTLADVKVAVDRFMLNGVNHIFYHGTSYSPADERWPGWLFYAAVHLNPRNSQWNHFGTLNKYIERCQSFLQSSSPDNDILLYYPVYDRFSTPGEERVEHFDGVDKQFANTAFLRAAESMQKEGYTFDYISDKQISNLQVGDHALITQGNARYKTIIIPSCKFIPAHTFQKINTLIREGATVIFFEGFPSTFSGFGRQDENQQLFDKAKAEFEKSTTSDDAEAFSLGKGKALVGNQLLPLLERTSIHREHMVDSGFQFIRKQADGNRTIYFLVNKSDQPFDGWLPVSAQGKSAVLYDPMTGQFGKAQVRESSGGLEVYVQLPSEGSFLVELYPKEVATKPFHHYHLEGPGIPIDGKWKVTFMEGGPSIPPPLEIDSLQSWTQFGEAYADFSGTASYTTTFKHPGNASHWFLYLGTVHESAEVILNGKVVGTIIDRSAQIAVDPKLLQSMNHLEIRVSNLMANRIAYLDRQNIFWKKFYNVNFPARKAENRVNGLFDATHWQPRESGLIGPVLLAPLEEDF